MWPKNAAIAKPEIDGAEIVQRSSIAIAGRGFTVIRNVSQPTMTIYPAKGRRAGAAIVVFPGGGYQELAIDLEGSEVCDWATARGIACAVLKYRVPQKWWHGDCHCQREPRPFLPLQNAQRAIALLRQRAEVCLSIHTKLA